MGKQPAVIIIARHGARLDAVNKGWHLTSPTPYDPPLTYGGWSQARALGLRIAAFLEQRQDINATQAAAATHDNPSSSASIPPSGGDGRTRRKRYKVFIHSSPFTRCVQTGIGVSAGLSQYQGIQAGNDAATSRPRSSSNLQSSPRLHAVDEGVLLARSHLRKSLRDQQKQDNRTTLRVDAYLGEWLSPDYFDMITPPPPSNLMVASAKAELVKREGLQTFQQSPNLGASHGNLWGSRGSEASLTPRHSDGPLDMKQLAHALPARDRTSSYSSGRISPFGRQALPRARSNEPVPTIGYVPPVPSYAISPTESIPKGYVAHARDACVDVDNQWDSMREPLNWGDGGEFGEEWSAMHKRFRKGLNHLIEWYETHGTHNVDEYDEAVSGNHDEVEPEAVDEEIVVVLVTHGAGCNALIGALTEQPVLLDVGMASLTMAFRKDTTLDDEDSVSPKSASPLQPNSTETSPIIDRTGRRIGSVSTGLSQKYEMKIVASGDHLRAGADPARPSTPAPVSPMLAAAGTIPESRKRGAYSSHAAAGSPIEPSWAVPDYPRGGVSSALGSIRRLSTQMSQPPQRSQSVTSTTSMSGLWTPTTPTFTDRERSSLSHEVTNGDVVEAQPQSIDNNLGITYVPDNAHHAVISTVRRPSLKNSTESNGVPATSMLDTVTESPSKEGRDHVADLPKVSPQVPTSLGRTLSQKGLWGSAPSGYQERDRTPKRRWTLQQENKAG